jgi:hypothetical protein
VAVVCAWLIPSTGCSLALPEPDLALLLPSRLGDTAAHAHRRARPRCSHHPPTTRCPFMHTQPAFSRGGAQGTHPVLCCVVLCCGVAWQLSTPRSGGCREAW